MKSTRPLFAWLSAVVLVTVGAVGIVLTRGAWAACEGHQTAFTDSCLRAMNEPSHLSPLQGLWLVAVVACITALVVIRVGPARRFALAALLLVLVMNYLTEYAIWLGVVGGHWDVPPGTGYSQSIAFLVAGLLVALAAALSRRPRPVVSDTGLEPMTSSV